MPNPASARGDPLPAVKHQAQRDSSLTSAMQGTQLCEYAVKDLSNVLQDILVQIQDVKCRLDDQVSPLAAQGRKLLEDVRGQLKVQEFREFTDGDTSFMEEDNSLQNKENRNKANPQAKDEQTSSPRGASPKTRSPPNGQRLETDKLDEDQQELLSDNVEEVDLGKSVGFQVHPSTSVLNPATSQSTAVTVYSENVIQTSTAMGNEESGEGRKKKKRMTQIQFGEVLKEHHNQKGGNMFGEMIQDQEALVMDDYDVRNFYRKEGIAQFIARKDMFTSITLVVIGVNAIYIAFDAEYNDSKTLYTSEPIFIISDNFFCLYFVLEWLIRFFAFASKTDATRDTWMVFDTALAALIVMETWILPLAFQSIIEMVPLQLLKLPRLLRLVRMGRLVRSFPELVAMMKGVKVASRAVGSAFMLLFGLVYVFSCIILITLDSDLRDTAGGEIEYRYGNLIRVMWTLLVDGTFMDNLRIAFEPLLDHKEWVASIALAMFVLLSATTVLNMLIGVLCEVVTAVAAAEKEETAIRYVQRTVLVMLKVLDEDKSGKISKEELSHIFDNSVAMEVLDDLKVDVGYLVDSLDMHFAYHEDEVSIQKVMDLILMLRGDRTPTVKDMIHAQSFNSWRIRIALDEQQERLKEITRNAKDVEKKLKAMDYRMRSQMSNLGHLAAANNTGDQPKKLGASSPRAGVHSPHGGANLRNLVGDSATLERHTRKNARKSTK